MVDATFPLKLDNTRNMEAFFIGIEDKRVRDGLRHQKNAPKDLIEIVDLVEDPTFLAMASSVFEKLRGPGVKSIARADSPIKLQAPTVAPNLDDARTKAIREESAAINAYIAEHYPHGLTLLNKFAQASLAQPHATDRWAAANAQVAANAAAVVNAAVYANVAVATMAVVAAAVVAVIAAAV